MKTPSKLAAFAAVLALVFGGALAVGAAVGPIDVGGNTPMHEPATDMSSTDTTTSDTTTSDTTTTSSAPPSRSCNSTSAA